MLARNFIRIIITVIFVFYAHASIAAIKDSDSPETANFDIYEKIKSSNQDTQCICLRFIIREPEKIDEGRLVFDVMAIYQNGRTTHVRLLAIKALEKVGNNTAIQFLRNAYHKQSNPKLRNAIWVALNKIST